MTYLRKPYSNCSVAYGYRFGEVNPVLLFNLIHALISNFHLFLMMTTGQWLSEWRYGLPVVRLVVRVSCGSGNTERSDRASFKSIWAVGGKSSVAKVTRASRMLLHYVSI